MIKYVLFDLDGTLTDSAAGIINSIKYAAKKLELSEPSPKTLQKFIGPPIAYSFEHFLGLDADTVRRAITAYREYFSERGNLKTAFTTVCRKCLKGSGTAG